MKPIRIALQYEIALIIVAKLLLITAIWWGFMRDERVSVDAASLTQHFAQKHSSSSQPSTQGEPHAQ